MKRESRRSHRAETRISRIALSSLGAQLLKLAFFPRKTYLFNDENHFEHPCILAVYHDEMLPILQYFRHSKAIFLTSRNHWGRALGGAVKSMGYTIVHGSPKKGGKQALREIRQRIEAHDYSAVITVDGSRGPRHRIKAGAIALAQRARVPLYLLRVKCPGFRLTFSWDKFYYPLPFSNIHLYSRRLDTKAHKGYVGIRKDMEKAQEIMQDLIPEGSSDSIRN